MSTIEPFEYIKNKNNGDYLFVLGGANDDVTGSSFMIISKTEQGISSVLLDNGVFQGNEAKNSQEYFEIRKKVSQSLSGVLISHGHLDHIGGLPYVYHKTHEKTPIYSTNIVKEQMNIAFDDQLRVQKIKLAMRKSHNLKVYNIQKKLHMNKNILQMMTDHNIKNTNDLIDILVDSHDNHRHNKKNTNENGKSFIKNLYKQIHRIPSNRDQAEIQNKINTLEEMLEVASFMDIDGPKYQFTMQDVINTKNRIISQPYEQSFLIDGASPIKVTFYHSGHILGSSQILVETNNGTTLYSGDIGRYRDNKFLEPPASLQKRIDTVIMESTLGNRMRTSTYADDTEKIIDICKKAGSHILFPTISYQRTQEIICILVELKMQHRIDLAYDIQLFGGTSNKFTDKIFMKYAPDTFDNLHELNFYKKVHIPTFTPYRKTIAIGPAGMLMGPSLNTLHELHDDPLSHVILSCYQAEGTQGRNLLQNKKFTYEGIEYDYPGNVHKLESFSGHGDKEDLLTYVNNIHFTTNKKAILVHGTESAKKNLAEDLCKQEINTVIPNIQDIVTLHEKK